LRSRAKIESPAPTADHPALTTVMYQYDAASEASARRSVRSKETSGVIEKRGGAMIGDDAS